MHVKLILKILSQLYGNISPWMIFIGAIMGWWEHLTISKHQTKWIRPNVIILSCLLGSLSHARKLTCLWWMHISIVYVGGWWLTKWYIKRALKGKCCILSILLSNLFCPYFHLLFTISPSLATESIRQKSIHLAVNYLYCMALYCIIRHASLWS